MKMKSVILLILIVISSTIVISSCKKTETKPDCEINKYGTITVSNSSSNPYNFYIDGVFQIQLKGGAISTKININEGNSRKLYAEQVSGYILYPTTKTEYLNVIKCSDYGWQIP
jgi:hypothetical protein